LHHTLRLTGITHARTKAITSAQTPTACS
jgi:hypothetical protein